MQLLNFVSCMLPILSTFFPQWVFKAGISVDGNVFVSFFRSISFLFTCSLQCTGGKILAASDISNSELFASWHDHETQCKLAVGWKIGDLRACHLFWLGSFQPTRNMLRHQNLSSAKSWRVADTLKRIQELSTFRSRHVMINLISIKRMTIRVVRMMFIIIFFTDTLKPIQELSSLWSGFWRGFQVAEAPPALARSEENSIQTLKCASFHR